MLTREDRRQIRAGAMKATGQRHAGLIFWSLILPAILGGLAVLSVTIWAAGLLHSWWLAALGPWLQGDQGPLQLALIVGGALFVILLGRWLFRPRGHYRRGQR